MQCPSCAKPFAAELSVCPGCGAMTSLYNHADNKPKLIKTDSATGLTTAAGTAQVTVETRFMKKDSTSTLLEFPANRSKTTEWREEIKNRVREREDRRSIENGATDDFSTAQIPEIAQTKSAVVINITPKRESESVVTRALRRLENSRQTYTGEEVEEAVIEKSQAEIARESKFQTKTDERETNLSIVQPRTPRKVATIVDDEFFSPFETHAEESGLSEKVEKNDDFFVENSVPKETVSPETVVTNKVAPRKVVADFDYDDFPIESIGEKIEPVSRSPRKAFESIDQTPAPRVRQNLPQQNRQNGDYAPLSSRFFAGTTDFIFTAIVTAIILAATNIPSREASTVLSFLTVLAIFSTVSTVYFTSAILLVNKTIGSSLFGLKTVRVEDGTAPGFVQSLTSGLVCVLSLVLFGLGFVTIFLNSEKRALHDLISGTVTIQE